MKSSVERCLAACGLVLCLTAGAAAADTPGAGYVTNAGTGNISGFVIEPDGSASVLNADGVTATTGGNPTDVALSHESRYLYARVAALNQIAVFRIESDGSLTPLAPLADTPGGLAGLAAY